MATTQHMAAKHREWEQGAQTTERSENDRIKAESKTNFDKFAEGKATENSENKRIATDPRIQVESA